MEWRYDAIATESPFLKPKDSDESEDLEMSNWKTMEKP